MNLSPAERLEPSRSLKVLEDDITTALLRAERKRNDYLERREHIRRMQRIERDRIDRQAAATLAIVIASLGSLFLIVLLHELNAF